MLIASYLLNIVSSKHFTYTVFLLIHEIRVNCTITGWPVGAGSCGGGCPEGDSSVVQVQRGGEKERRGIIGAGETAASHGEGERRNGGHMGHGYVMIH